MVIAARRRPKDIQAEHAHMPFDVTGIVDTGSTVYLRIPVAVVIRRKGEWTIKGAHDT